MNVSTTVLPIEIMTVEVAKTDYNLIAIGVIGFILNIICYYYLVRKIKRLKQNIMEDVTMDELRKIIGGCQTDLVKTFEDIVRKAQESEEGLDMLGFNTKVAEINQKIDTAFIEAKLRNTGNKKRGWF